MDSCPCGDDERKMETQKLEKNRLGDHEVAELEQELARTPRRRFDSATLSDSAEPPPRLASRTCVKIWQTIDNEVKEQDYTPNSGTFLDSAYFSPETVLPASYLLGTSEPEEIKSVGTPKPAKRVEIDEEPPRRSTPWVGLIASISVGMVIAGFLFPMIAFVTRSTQSYMTENWEREINRRVGQYEQIHANQGNGQHIEALLPYNLAASSWQELQTEMFTHFFRKPNTGGTHANLLEGRFGKWGEEQSPRQKLYSVEPPPNPLFSLFTDFPDWDTLTTSDMNAKADSMLLVTACQDTSVRSAFGQNILLKDGRVFFRVLPGTEPPKK